MQPIYILSLNESIKDDYITIKEKWVYSDICITMEALSDMSLIQQVHMSPMYQNNK